jgi:hypothetical protein
MRRPSGFIGNIHTSRLLSALALLAVAIPCVAQTPASTLAWFPDSPAGVIARQVIELVNGDTPAQLRQWARTATANLQMVWETRAAIALTSHGGPSNPWMLVEHVAGMLAAVSEAR